MDRMVEDWKETCTTAFDMLGAMHNSNTGKHYMKIMK